LALALIPRASDSEARPKSQSRNQQPAWRKYPLKNSLRKQSLCLLKPDMELGRGRAFMGSRWWDFTEKHLRL
jgi:hypothetical protein